MAFCCAVILVWKFSPPVSHVIQHPTVVPHLWLIPHSINIFLLWPLLLTWALKHHYAIIQSHTSLKLLILLRIMSPFKGTSSFPSFMSHMIIKAIITPKKPTLPPPVVFAPDRCSIKLVYQLILGTDVNLTNITPFVHYVGYPPCQSASIAIPQCLTSHGYLSPKIPGCFISNNKEAFLKGDIMVLGLDTCQKVVMAGIIEVGRHFILCEVKEVGSIPMGVYRSLSWWLHSILICQSFFAFCYSFSWHSSPASFDPQLSLGS